MSGWSLWMMRSTTAFRKAKGQYASCFDTQGTPRRAKTRAGAFPVKRIRWKAGRLSDFHT